MTTFSWREDLSVGNSFMDNEHRHLMALVSMLHVATDEDKEREVLEVVLSDLIQYALTHFRHEEDVMQEMQYAEFSAHKEEHDRLTLEVLLLRKRYGSGQVALTGEVAMFLRDWLFDHIRRVDKKLAQAIKDAKLNTKYLA